MQSDVQGTSPTREDAPAPRIFSQEEDGEEGEGGDRSNAG